LKDFKDVFEAKRRHNWVVLFGNAEKSPEICGPWGELKEKGTQTEDELQALIDRAGNEARNWGPICGVDDLFSPDFDWAFIYGIWYRNFGDRGQTLTYETPNGGARVLFRTNEKPPGDPFKTTLNTEFKGNHYVAVGGVAFDINGDLKPYKLIIDEPIRRDDKIIADTTTFFNGLLDGRYDFLRYKCINYHLSEKRPKEGKWIVLNHRQSLAINAFMVFGGCDDFEIHNFRRCCYDYDGQRYTTEYEEKTTNAQIKSTRTFIEEGGLPFPCRPTDTNEGLAAIFSFDEAGCSGCLRRSAWPSEPEDLFGGAHRVDIGEKSLLFLVDRASYNWRFKLKDLNAPETLTTSWATLESPEKLHLSPKAKFIRKGLKIRCGEGWERILDKAITFIQDNETHWFPPVLLGPTDDVEVPTVPQEKPPLSEEERAEVDKIIGSPNPLEGIKSILGDIAAGEEENKQHTFVLLTSGKSEDPREREMILFKSRAGAGKTTLIDSLVKPYKTKIVGRFTERALDYTDLSGYEILYLKEVGYMDDEKQGVSTLKFLSSDDQGYTVEFTVGSPSEGFTTMQRRIPPMTVVSSTTRIELDPQFERRCWIINLDESAEQTDRIREWQSKQEKEELEVSLGIRRERSYDRAQRILSWIVNEIPQHKVSILFPMALLGILERSKLRTRGDYRKIMRLLKYYARINMKKLPTIEGNDGKPIILPTPRAALDILKVAWGPITLMTLEMDKRTQKLFDGFEKMNWTTKGTAIAPDKRAELAMKMGYATQTIYIYLNELEKVGILSSDEKRPKTYWLLESLDTIRRKASSLSSKLENEEPFISEMCKEAQETLGSLSSKISEETMEHIRPYFEEEYQRVCVPPHPPTSFEESELGEETNQKPEEGQNEAHSEDLRINSAPIDEKPNLQENLEKVLNIFQKEGKVQKGKELLALMNAQGIGETEGKRLLNRLEKDGMIQPHPTLERWYILTPGGS